MSQDIAVSLKNLTVSYPLGKSLLGPQRYLHAVKDVNLDIPKGSFFGLVGESGSGKTTLGRATLNAAPVSDGSIAFRANDGEEFDVASLSGQDEYRFRQQAQLIFQDPYAALSPRMTVRDIIAEPLEVMKLTKSRAETDERVREIARQCRLNVEHLRRFPHAFSGGQRQRISIARALVTQPSYIVADESVAALDVSIQADILNLLKSIQRETGVTFLFISHDLSVVAHTCDVVAVMYLGRLVEIARPDDLFSQPRHPYTKALRSAVPKLDPRKRGGEIKLLGEIPSATKEIPGCKFHTRCAFAKDLCRQAEPGLETVADSHQVACHFQEELSQGPKLETASS